MGLQNNTPIHHGGDAFQINLINRGTNPEETKEPSYRIESPLEVEINNEAMRAELDLVEEIWLGAALCETKLKQQITLRHDDKVIKRNFKVDTLVLRKNMKDSRGEKFSPIWEAHTESEEKRTTSHTT